MDNSQKLKALDLKDGPGLVDLDRDSIVRVAERAIAECDENEGHRREELKCAKMLFVSAYEELVGTLTQPLHTMDEGKARHFEFLLNAVAGCAFRIGERATTSGPTMESTEGRLKAEQASRARAALQIKYKLMAVARRHVIIVVAGGADKLHPGHKFAVSLNHALFTEEKFRELRPRPATRGYSPSALAVAIQAILEERNERHYGS
jgi:hypothetical protein